MKNRLGYWLPYLEAKNRTGPDLKTLRTIWKHSLRRLQLCTSIHAIYTVQVHENIAIKCKEAKTLRTSYPGVFGCTMILSFNYLVFTELLYPVHVNWCVRRDSIPFRMGTASKNTAMARQYVFDVLLTRHEPNILLFRCFAGNRIPAGAIGTSISIVSPLDAKPDLSVMLLPVPWFSWHTQVFSLLRNTRT